LFLDASVLLAAAASARGASRAVFDYANPQRWHLLSSPFAVNEVLRNLRKVPTHATAD
jgi:hypothetical protein